MNVLEARGIELAYESDGPERPRTVFVHETGVDSSAWRRTARHLAELGHGAVLYDRRGWGASSAPDGYRRTTVEEQSEDLAELIGALGPVARLCGAGLGALVALDLLVRRPDAAECAVLVEPLIPGLVPAATDSLGKDRESLRDAVQERGEAGMVELYLEGGLEALGPGVERLPGKVTEAARRSPRSLAAELGAPAIWSLPLHRLGDLEHTVTIVASGDTPALPREAGEALAARLAEPRLAEVPGAGPPHVREPEILAGIVSDAVPR